MEIKTSEKILKYIHDRGQASGNELSHFLGLTDRAVRKQLNTLLEKGDIVKIGRSPKVYYILPTDKKNETKYSLPKGSMEIINKNFLVISPSGEKIEGFPGFVFWCEKRGELVEKTAQEYIATVKKYGLYKKNGLIDGMYKMKHTFSDIYLDKLFYLDFYSVERFGKTKLGQFLLYAKQSQSRELIKELVGDIKPTIERLLKKQKIDAVGFIPPTVKREVQFMKELERNLQLPLPVINIVKIKTPIIVPQKTLNKLEDRVENAKKTIIVDETKKYKTILLLDDALGSGATLNETAKKLKQQGVAEKVIGLSITGSFSGFEVISEV